MKSQKAIILEQNAKLHRPARGKYHTHRPNFIDWLLTQNAQDLANKLNCNRQLIYFWRSGKCSPNAEYTLKLLQKFPDNLNVKILRDNLNQ